MKEDFWYYISWIVTFIIGVLLFKKVTSCLLKATITVFAVIIFIAIYYLYIK